MNLLFSFNINIREYIKGKKKIENPEKLAAMVHKTTKNKEKHNTICVGQHFKQTKTDDVNKTWAFPQATGGKYEPYIVFMRKSQRALQDGTQNAKTHNR